MLCNIKPRSELSGLARLKSRSYVTKTVNPLLVLEEVSNGWQALKINKRSVLLSKSKPHGEWLEDRLWMLLYRLGISHLSGKGGETILLNPKDPDSPKNQIDVMGIDEEIAVAFECKSQIKPDKRAKFQEDLAKFRNHQQRIAHEVNNQYSDGKKRQVVLAMLLSNVILTEEDKKRAEEHKVILFDEQDLAYYEQLANHLGPAAKYQFFADMLPGKPVPGLEIKLPAIKSRIGNNNCYTFSISPEYLLKIAFVSHRMKGKASDVDAYQRMINKNRLKKIKDFISNDGVFPTNIVINLDKIQQFDPSSKEENQDKTHGILGILTIRPSYKSAWIIDGQHRLFAYSGHPKASKSLLSVLAFEKLAADKQAQMFTTINAEQKSVPQSLLRELYAELNWEAPDPSIRAVAIISKAVQTLDSEIGSPFYHRIRKTDDNKEPQRCITLTSFCQALEKSGFYISMQKKGNYDYGALWAFDNKNDSTLKRTISILKQWFETIENDNKEWWDLGSAPGGGLSMSDGVTVCVNVLRSVFQYLEGQGHKLRYMEDSQLKAVIQDYGLSLATYLADLSADDRKRFREYRGIQGQVRATRECQVGIKKLIPDFDPPGLKDFIELEGAQTNSKAQAITESVENTLRSVIVDELKIHFGQDENQWWTEIPIDVRLNITERFEKDNRKLGSQQEYLELVHYKPIISENWALFEPIMAHGKGSKTKRLQWLSDFAEVKKQIGLGAKSSPITLEKLKQLEDYQDWLTRQLGLDEIDSTSNNDVSDLN